jgi:hypothetical protein
LPAIPDTRTRRRTPTSADSSTGGLDRDLLSVRENADPRAQQSVPALRPELEELERKLIDVLPVVRDNVYHPDFQGSFSIKYVLGPMVPGLRHNDVVIVNGLVASVEIARLLLVSQKIPDEERDRVRRTC